ncbi:hypothetical protein O3G_MSEX014178, partial [Manduca sexta]
LHVFKAGDVFQEPSLRVHAPLGAVRSDRLHRQLRRAAGLVLGVLLPQPRRDHLLPDPQ